MSSIPATFDKADNGKMYISVEDETYEVVSILDADGVEVDDEEKAAGGIVKFADGRFGIFHF